MKLGALITLLEKYPEDRHVQRGFGNPHSWRGSYDELAFEPIDETTVGEILQAARSAVNVTYEGWKGGEYLMTLDTPVNIDNRGDWSDGALDHYLYQWLSE